MATTIQEPVRTDARRPEPGGSGNGGWGNLVPTDGGKRSVEDRSPPPASTGIWVVMAAITMSFAALTSALIVRKGGSFDWQHFQLPPILFADTLVLLASSVTLEIARRRVTAFMGGAEPRVEYPGRWLYVTLLLGLFFVAGQYVAWQQLKAQGLYLATNPSSSFFYVLTAGHLLHVLGGLGGLIYVIRKLERLALRRSTMDATVRYWHFIDILWIYLLFLLWAKV